jgi:hypothetical protein
VNKAHRAKIEESKSRDREGHEAIHYLICSDGWDNVIHRPLMNVMLVCPVGDIFIGSVDIIGHKKTKEYIAGELKTYIEAIGPNNVTQICTDNASAMLRASDELVATYSHLYKQGCAAHILDLLLDLLTSSTCSHSRPS